MTYFLLSDAKAGGGAASAATAVAKKKMAITEAYQILNIEKVPGGVSSKVINEVSHHSGLLLDTSPLLCRILRNISNPMTQQREAPSISSPKSFEPKKLF
jgi:hypothetical protein